MDHIPFTVTVNERKTNVLLIFVLDDSVSSMRYSLLHV